MSVEPQNRDHRIKDNQELTMKVFITNLDGEKDQSDLHVELQKMFKKYGTIAKLNVKRNKNGKYSFAFLQYQKAQDALEAIKELDQCQVFGKAMRVRQDRQQNQGCFNCKKQGHFARECPYLNNQPNYSRRYQRSKDRDEQNRRRHKRRDYSRSPTNSYERERRKKGSRKYREESRRRSKSYSRSRSPNRGYQRRDRQRPEHRYKEREYRGRDYDYRQHDESRRRRYSRSHS